MGNIIDYARTETRSFEALPFREADALVLAQLSYDEVPKCVLLLDDLVAKYGTLQARAKQFDIRRPIASLRMLRKPPFGGATIARADDELNHDKPDDSLVGWKEDFNMAFQYPVPAQVSAAEYLKKVASLWDGPILLTGHSKGGNLAVYAAMNAEDEIKDRVERIYSLDGPGFPEEVVKSFEYASVSDRIVKIVPDSSVVGMVFETPERCVVVKSDVDGIMQHFAFSWQMHGGEFAKAEDVADSSVVFNKSLNGWLAGLSKEQREHAVDALFSVLEASGAGSISAIVAAGPKVIPEMLGTYVGLSSADRRNINQALVILLQAALARNPKVQRK